MKAILALCLFAAAAPAQTPAAQPPRPADPAKAEPRTRVIDVDVGKGLATGNSQGVPPETVVATIDGKKFTAEQLDKLVQAMPPQVQQNYNADRKEFVRQWGLLTHLADVATKANLEAESPYKERLEFMRVQTMAQSAIDNANRTVIVPAEEQRKFYDDNPDRFTQTAVKVIYIPFVADPSAATAPAGKKLMSEAEAKAKAEDLVKQIRGGADFVKLVKEHSEDAASAAKDGDFGTLKKADALPEPIKTAVFALKKGEVSDPVRQANGFYIFRAETTGVQPYDRVKDDIHRELQQRHFQQWFEGVRKAVDVKFENETFFATKPNPNSPVVVTPVPAQPKK